MLYNYILAIIVLHFIGDWLLQSRWMGNNKSKFNVEGWQAWAIHTLTYTITMLAGISIFSYIYDYNTFVSVVIPQWVLLNGLLHGIQDKITSNITHKLFEQKKEHGFFTVIGFDGMLHYLTLFISARLMLGL